MEYDKSALDEVRKSRLLISQLDEWIVALIEPYLGARIIEIGCGHGNIIRHFSDRELVIGIDIDEPSVTFVNSAFGLSGNTQAYVGDVNGPEFLDFAKFECDTAISLNVLEHIEDDELSLRQIRKILSPGGRLILVLPAHEFLYGSMDRSIGHFRRYTRQSLGRKLAKAGLEVQFQEYVNPIGAVGWLVNGRALKRTVPPQAQLRMFNHLMPVISKLGNVTRGGFGLSLMSVSANPPTLLTSKTPDTLAK
ncbi:MAG: class I SAM-dependent methyltransferase [Anaerolineales bacterium]